jgi:DNA repair exonuclease SbcCD ATPase subunit
MITKLEIVNFRGIKFLSLDLTKISIISGKNDIGKSTALNAANWLLTNKLLTDKYGEGENDIQSIIPNNHTKGEHTQVSIWLETGTKYTKVLKRGYDRSTGKPNKHDTEYLINDSKCNTQKEFYETLYEQLGFTPKFTKLKVDEVRLFTDPLYALLKLDYKELRALLVAMGCTVSNEELYRSGFENMRKYEAQYLGKWDVMRKNLKDKSKTLNEDRKKLESQLELFNSLEPFDETELNDLLKQKEELLEKKSKLKATGGSSMVLNLEKQINELTIEIESKMLEKKVAYSSHIKDLELEAKNLVNNIESKKTNATREIIEKIMKTNDEILSHKNLIADLKFKNLKAENDKGILETTIKSKTELLNNASIELGDLINGSKDEFICPICGSPIDIHQDERKKHQDELSEKIAAYDNEIESSKVKLDELEKTIAETSEKISKLESNKQELENTEKDLESQKVKIEQDFNVDAELKAIDDSIAEYNQKITTINLEFKDENDQLNALKLKKTNCEVESNSMMSTALNELDTQIQELDTKINAQYIIQNDNERKEELSSSLKWTIESFNDNESLLARVNSFIHTMCKMINDKAKALTGFDFVMLEENLTNDGISEVCYIVDEKGIPFKDINTARKTIMGIQFIESCRKIAGNNNLPILADRLEGLDADNLSKLKGITENQIICTRVSDGDLRVEGV